MCKILIISGIKPEYRSNTIKFVKKMSDIMSVVNSDGLGYAAVDKDGNLFAERWLTNKEAFNHHIETDNKLISTFGKALKYPTTTKNYTTYGEPDLDKMVAITLHTRLATSSRGMENTHPFITEDTSVIHNGVIHNHNNFKLTLSSCDSEAILVSYLNNNVGVLPERISDLAGSLTGYYACGMFSRDSENNRILDVFKGNNDDLYITHVAELGTSVIASRDDQIKLACEQLGFKHSTIYQLNDGFLMRFNPLSGEQLSQHEFTVGYKFNNNNYNTRSNYNPENYKVTDVGTNVTQLPKRTNLTPEEIEFLKLPPSINEIDDTEKYEFLTASGYWGH